MKFMAIWVGLGGALGSVLRFLLGNLIPFDTQKFPWATFGVNMAGCCIIGLLFFLRKDQWSFYFWVPGFLGGFTTYSGFAWEALRMWNAGNHKGASVYLLASVIFGLIFALLGWNMGKQWSNA